jgi:hypothetical protein
VLESQKQIIAGVRFDNAIECLVRPFAGERTNDTEASCCGSMMMGQVAEYA